MFKRKKLGQSTAEYAIVIGLVIAAAVAMQVYVKRAIQGKIRGAVDFKPNAMFTTNQFEPDYSTSNMEMSRTGNKYVETRNLGEVFRNVVQERTSSSGTQNITAP